MEETQGDSIGRLLAESFQHITELFKRISALEQGLAELKLRQARGMASAANALAAANRKILSDCDYIEVKEDNHDTKTGTGT